jgi:hypothetical protein
MEKARPPKYCAVPRCYNFSPTPTRLRMDVRRGSAGISQGEPWCRHYLARRSAYCCIGLTLIYVPSCPVPLRASVTSIHVM